MSGKTKTSESNKKYFLLYKAENRCELNILTKIDKHLKNHPNDLQSKERITPNYKSKKLDNISKT